MALLVTAGSKIYNLASLIGTVFNEIYHYTAGSTHLCNHPAIKDIPKNARDRAWESRQNFSNNEDMAYNGTRGLAAVLKLYKHYFEHAEYEELWYNELRTTNTCDAQPITKEEELEHASKEEVVELAYPEHPDENLDTTNWVTEKRHNEKLNK